MRPTYPFATQRPRGFALGLVMLLGLAAVGCDHATDFDGPSLIDRFGDFALLDPLEANRATVDFAEGESVTFSARFNKRVNWVLEIVGQESGAVKRFEDFSAELTAENTRWTGGTTELPFFKDEPVEARLFVPEEESDTTRASVEVLTPRSYPGIVIADFEGDDAIAVFDPEFEFEEIGISTEVPPAQGEGFYLLRGTDAPQTNFFVGTVRVFPPGGGTFEVPTNVASELYFNCFLYGYGTAYTIAVVEVIVDANGNGTYDENGQGVPLDTVVPLGGDVEFPNIGIVDFEGWQAYSEPASSFGKFGVGLTDQQTQQIVAVNVVLISDENAQPNPPLQVEYGIDYLTFTAGGPLQL